VDACRAPVKGNRAVLEPIDRSFAKGAEAALRTGPNPQNIRQVVMYASQRGEVAVPAEGGHHSYYTGVLLDGLKAGHRQVKDLQAYLQLHTPDHRPQPDVEGDGRLWIAPEGGSIPQHDKEPVRGSAVYLTSLRPTMTKPKDEPVVSAVELGATRYERAISFGFNKSYPRKLVTYQVPPGVRGFECFAGASTAAQRLLNGKGPHLQFQGLRSDGNWVVLHTTSKLVPGASAERVTLDLTGVVQLGVRAIAGDIFPFDVRAGMLWLGDARFAGGTP
jgi:hypothetical protein